MLTPVCAFVLTLVAFAPAGASPVAPGVPCDYEVYSALLEDQFTQVARSAFLIAARTEGKFPFGRGDAIAAALRRMEDVGHLPAGLAEEFARRNASDVALSAAAFRGAIPVLLVDAAEHERIAEEVLDATGFPPHYPAVGILTFSRVAFTEDGRFAVVHTFFHCGGRCGGGTLFLMERGSGRWIVRKTQETIGL